MRDHPGKSAKQFRGVSSGNSRQLTIRNLIANLIVATVAIGLTMIAGMCSIPTDESVDRMQLRMAKKAHEHFELSRQAVLGCKRSACPFPKCSAPKRCVTMNVLIAASEKWNARA